MSSFLKNAIRSLNAAAKSLDGEADFGLTGGERNKARSARRLIQQLANALQNGRAYETVPFAREFDADVANNS